MKQFFIIILGLFYSTTMLGECSSTGLFLFPKGDKIKQNSIFILDGYNYSRDIILGLNSKYNIYLKSGDKKIKLLVTDICEGDYYLTQAILKPETELEAGLKYTMYIDNLPKDELLFLTDDYAEKIGKVGLKTYEVIAERDTEKPILKSKPKEIDKVLIGYGCGPEIYVLFSSSVKDKSEVIVKTTVRSLETGRETTYYVGTHNKVIKVGHGMCDGAFNFYDGNDYEVEFSFMDASGNLTAWTGERIKFTKPINETR